MRRMPLPRAWLDAMCARRNERTRSMSLPSSQVEIDDASLQVTPVTTRAQHDAFIRLPGRLYRDDPQWVEPLHFERRQHLSSKNPVFEHLDWQGWLAWRSGKPVGRIGAQVDRLHRQYHGDDTGQFGLLDAVDDPAVFSALFNAAEGWLASRGARRITGPFNLTINDECGLLVEGFDTPPVMMMGHAPPYSALRLEGQGYAAAKDLLAYWMRVDTLAFTPAMRRMIERWHHRVHVRPLDRRRFDQEMTTLREIFNDAWARNWGFTPFTEAEFRAMGADLKRLVPPDLIQIAEVDGEPAAFIVGLPNLNELIAPLNGQLLPLGWLKLLWGIKMRKVRTGRVPLMGVRQAYQFSRLGPTLALVLIEAIQQSFLKQGIESIEMSWILEDNAGMRNILENIGAYSYKRYRLYEKTL
ncbi:hypothetical protein [Halomonas sp.]